jgi:hypothetical protein
MYEGYYWATYRERRAVWIAVGSDTKGGEQNFQCFLGHEIVKVSELSDIVKIEE